MKNIIAYLTFSGNCREAMHFYRDCIGGELKLQTVGESPMAKRMPTKMANCILHSSLTHGNGVLMATDITPPHGIVKGNNISMMLDCNSEMEIKALYKNLSLGGHSNHPLEDTFWGALFGDLTDKYGNHWLLNFTRETNT